MGKAVGRFLMRFNRLLVWPTLVLFMILTVSGYGILNPRMIGALTGGFLNRALSLSLHAVMALPVLILLMIHVLIEVRSLLVRWGVGEGKLLDAFLLLLGIFVVTLLLSMQYLVA